MKRHCGETRGPATGAAGRWSWASLRSGRALRAAAIARRRCRVVRQRPLPFRARSREPVGRTRGRA